MCCCCCRQSVKPSNRSCLNLYILCLVRLFSGAALHKKVLSEEAQHQYLQGKVRENQDKLRALKMSLFNRNQVSKERKPIAFLWKITQYNYISKTNRLHLQHDKIHLEKNYVKYHIALISEGFPAGALSHIELMPNCCITFLPPSDRGGSGFLS